MFFYVSYFSMFFVLFNVVFLLLLKHKSTKLHYCSKYCEHLRFSIVVE